MTSPKSFVDFLNERHPENEKVLVALRFYLAEVTHDKLQRELLAEIKDSVGDPHKVQAALDQLKGRPRKPSAGCADISGRSLGGSR